VRLLTPSLANPPVVGHTASGKARRKQMAIEKEDKEKIVKEIGRNPKDTGFKLLFLLKKSSSLLTT
jgi:hypothetical protein